MNSNVKSLFSSMFRELHKSREYGGQIIANQGVFFGHLRANGKCSYEKALKRQAYSLFAFPSRSHAREMGI
jgi:hypothetical protein